MGNRGQKRAETVEDLPADKRACSSMEFRASSSNSSVQTQMNPTNSTPETNDHDMDTSSSASASSRSEGEHEKDSAYGSCDSDDAEQRHNDLRDYHRRRSSGDHGKFKRIITALSEETEPSGQLAVLTELCEVLSFCTENSLSSMTSDSLAPHLVKLAKHETNPDIMLLAIRAITYLCDVYPRSSAFLVRHDAVPALCQRLMAIEYLDVAEQCLQALEKISREQALACLQAGAIMAVLSFIEFFSTSIQRVAISTVVNICKKLPSECPSPFMEAVPILCNLLQYEDRQLVENVAVCLIRIVDRVSQSPEMLDELCTHGLIQQISHLINSNSRTTVSSQIYNGLLGLLVKLSSGSIVAFRTLYELNISSILKNILSTYDLSHGISSPHMLDGHSNQVYEVLKLLNELLPTAGDQDNQQLLDRESFLVSRPELLHKFGMDILPLIIQVVNSGANLCICYGCLSVINKFIHLSTSDMLVELLKNANISSFLAGVFTRKDPHVLFLALQIVELILQKLSYSFLDSFVKEGVFFAIDALLTPEKCPVLTPEKCSQLTIPVFNGVQLSFDSSQKSSSREVLRCLCFAFAFGRSAPVSERGSCKLENDSVYNLAKNIKTNYFSSELFDCDKTLTDVLQKLRTFSAALSDLMSVSTGKDAFDLHKEEFYSILHQVIKKLNGREPISTFEFIESGIVKSLVNYLSDRQSLREKGECCGVHDNIYAVEERLQVFTRTLLYSSDPLSQELPISTLIRKLQSALSSLENFPVILSHAAKLRNSFAVVPNGRCTTYPCIRVRFMRGEGETCLCDYSEDVLTVDPFSSMDAIEGYLWPKVMVGKNIESVTRAMDQAECLSLQSSSPTSSNPGGSPDHMEPNRMLTGLHVMQEDEVNLAESAPEQAVDLRETNHGASLNETHIVSKTTIILQIDDLYVSEFSLAQGSLYQQEGSAEKEVQFSSEADNDMETDLPASSSSDNSLPKLLFFLEGQQLNQALTLYQAILQQQIKDHEVVTSAKLWSQVYKVTYRRAIYGHGNPKGCSCSARNSDVSDKVGGHFFSSMFDSKLVSDLENPSPTYDILYLLKILERVNRFIFHIMARERISGFAEGKFDNLDNLKIAVPSVPQNEFVNSKLTEKLEQQMRDTFAVSTGAMPFWCNQLMASCPFLFSFEARCKYFRLAAFGPLLLQPHAPLSHSDSGGTSDRRVSSVSLPRKKFLVFRNRILDSAAQMMDLHASHRVLLEVEYNEEVGTGLGPTLEFYTLVSHEFEKSGLGMWREGYRSTSSIGLLTEDTHRSTSNIGLLTEDTRSVTCGLGLFPRPWSSKSEASDGIQFTEVVKRFVLLGQLVAKALQDGRVLDLHFSKAFYKLVLGQEIGLFDIQSFDPELGRTLLEFKAIVAKEKVLKSMSAENSTLKPDSSFQNTRIEDLYLDFTLPGYPDYILTSEPDCVVNMRNLEDYISLVVDAAINAGISRQVEAFKSGFNQVFPIKHLQIFTEEELEHLLCGEHESWAFNELLDHIKFDHGYTASSPPVISLLEIIQEFDKKERRAFLQFVTGAPRLPPGGLASLNPKLTIVRKHSSNWVDTDLPSVMTCANYLKLPPYSSKERMKEKLLYAITEGQGSFHLS